MAEPAFCGGGKIQHHRKGNQLTWKKNKLVIINFKLNIYVIRKRNKQEIENNCNN